MNATSTASKKCGSKSSTDCIPGFILSGIVIVNVFDTQSNSHGSNRTSEPHFMSGTILCGFLFTTAYM
jgi:hypothetical protein